MDSISICYSYCNISIVNTTTRNFLKLHLENYNIVIKQLTFFSSTEFYGRSRYHWLGTLDHNGKKCMVTNGLEHCVIIGYELIDIWGKNITINVVGFIALVYNFVYDSNEVGIYKTSLMYVTSTVIGIKTARGLYISTLEENRGSAFYICTIIVKILYLIVQQKETQTGIYEKIMNIDMACCFSDGTKTTNL